MSKQYVSEYECMYCGLSERKKNNESGEHLIPQALSITNPETGKDFSHGLTINHRVCKKCNSSFNIDEALIHLSEISLFHKIHKKSEKPQHRYFTSERKLLEGRYASPRHYMMSPDLHPLPIRLSLEENQITMLYQIALYDTSRKSVREIRSENIKLMNRSRKTIYNGTNIENQSLLQIIDDKQRVIKLGEYTYIISNELIYENDLDPEKLKRTLINDYDLNLHTMEQELITSKELAQTRPLPLTKKIQKRFIPENILINSPNTGLRTLVIFSTAADPLIDRAYTKIALNGLLIQEKDIRSSPLMSKKHYELNTTKQYTGYEPELKNIKDFILGNPNTQNPITDMELRLVKRYPNEFDCHTLIYFLWNKSLYCVVELFPQQYDFESRKIICLTDSTHTNLQDKQLKIQRALHIPYGPNDTPLKPFHCFIDTNINPTIIAHSHETKNNL